MKIKMLNHKINFIYLVTSAVLANLAGCGGSSSNSTQATNAAPIYTAVFDAGSSGTRLSFFKVTPGNGGYPIIELIGKYTDKMRDVPNDEGINDFLNNQGAIVLTGGDVMPAGCPGLTGLGPTDVEPCVIQPLLQKLDAAITTLNNANPALGLTKSQVKVELFATAGMRTEEIYNGGQHSADTIRQYYDQMKAYVANWGYNAGQFKTINGNSEEGLWTWINMNDQYFNAFGGNKNIWTDTPTTRGNFEVGGSSMQVAFPTTQMTPSTDGNVYSVTINGYTYNVYSKTFLGLGGDDARKFMRAYGYYGQNGEFAPDTSYNGGIDCFGTNASPSNTAEPPTSGVPLFYNAVFYPRDTTIQSNAVDNTWAPVLNPLNFPLMLNTGASALFNPSTCGGKFNAITSAVMALPRNSYGTIPSQQTPASYVNFVSKVAMSSAPFIGIDNFYWTAQSLGLTNSSNPISKFTQNQFDTAYGSICNSNYTGGPTNSKLQKMKECADATYMKDFLWRTAGLFTSAGSPSFEGVAPNDYPKDNELLTWTRGYLLKQYAN